MLTCLIVKNEQDMQIIKERNPEWYESLSSFNVESMVLFPLKDNGNILGYIWATNFDIKNLNNSDEYQKRYEMLLFARANIQKNALEKYGALEKILNEMETVENTLVFTAPEQIDGVLQILSSNDVLAHRITQEQGTVPETKYNGLTERQYLIECFKKNFS